MSADNLFDMLVKKYEMVPPGDITDTEHEDWLDKCQLPTQRRILTVFTMWLEDHRLLEEEPQIARRLTDFLTLISTPSPHATTAKLIIQSVERLVRSLLVLLMVPCSNDIHLFYFSSKNAPVGCRVRPDDLTSRFVLPDIRQSGGTHNPTKETKTFSGSQQ